MSKSVVHWLISGVAFLASGLAVHGGSVAVMANSKLNQGVREEHPRLLADASDMNAMRQRAAADPQFAAFAASVLKQADGLLQSEPVTRKLTGRRLLTVSRTLLRRTATLSMAWTLTGKAEYLKRGREEMLAVAAFEDWNPSHFLDTAEMTLGMAIGYDWMYPGLDESARRTIGRAIVEKGLRPSTVGSHWWIRAENNWGQVCHGGMVCGAIAAMEVDPALCLSIIERAVTNVVVSMHASYAPDGNYPEGPMYWEYGTSYNVILIAALEKAFGNDFGLTAQPGFRATPDYLEHVTGPTGLQFNYSDGGSHDKCRRDENTPALWWFANRLQRSELLSYDWSHLADGRKRVEALGPDSSSERFYSLTGLWWPQSAPAAASPRPLSWNGRGPVPVCTFRTAWNDTNALYVACKAGSPSANHGHMDIGTFVLDADGCRWAVDLGREDYNGIESRGMNLWDKAQKSDRWKILRLNTDGHSVLTVDGRAQRVAGEGRVESFVDRGDSCTVSLDLSDVYSGSLVRARRGIRMDRVRRTVLIEDTITALREGQRVRWGMVTPAEVRGIEGDRLVLGHAGKTLTLVQTGDVRGEWREIDTASARSEWDSPNPGTRMVAFEVRTTGRPQTLSVLAVPGSSDAGRTAK